MARNFGLTYHRYMFQGKEFDMMHSLRWHDHGARFADNTILRWTTMDPLCEKYYDTSPYVFCGNCFANQFDPDGKVPIRLISSATKYIRKAYQIYRKTGRLSPNNLKNAGISELIDVADDLITIFDGGTSTFDKIKAGADLIIGTDLNKGNLDIANYATKGKDRGSLSGTKKALNVVKKKLNLKPNETLPKYKRKSIARNS